MKIREAHDTRVLAMAEIMVKERELLVEIEQAALAGKLAIFKPKGISYEATAMLEYAGYTVHKWVDGTVCIHW